MTAHFDCYDDDDDDEAIYEERWRETRKRYMQSLPIHRRIATVIQERLERILSREVGMCWRDRDRKSPWWFRPASKIEFALRPYSGRKRKAI